MSDAQANVAEATRRLRRSRSSTLCPPAGEAALAAIRSLSPRLPPAHERLLAAANGLMVYHGYVRLFGLGCGGGCIDLLAWNDPRTWKFAWGRDLSGFLCFGESGWGDQYAYDLAELGRTRSPRVWKLTDGMMEPEVWKESFERFLAINLVKYSKAPYLSADVASFDKHGALSWDQHVVYVPSLLLGGVARDFENTMVVPARASMIINGDIHRQAMSVPAEWEPASVENYVDEAGRPRVRVHWVEEG